MLNRKFIFEFTEEESFGRSYKEKTKEFSRDKYGENTVYVGTPLMNKEVDRGNELTFRDLKSGHGSYFVGEFFTANSLFRDTNTRKFELVQK